MRKASVGLVQQGFTAIFPGPNLYPGVVENLYYTAILNRVNKNRYTFIIFDKTKNAYAGSTSFLNISNADYRLDIGATWYGKKFQRTGLNRNCKYLLLEYAFDHLAAERVEFKTDERNVASRTAIEKIGGQLEGILRRHTLMYDGYRRNTVYYSILKNEWQQMKTPFLDYKGATDRKKFLRQYPAISSHHDGILFGTIQDL